MNTFLVIVIMFILIDIYYRWRQQKHNNGLFFYSSAMCDYYEQIFTNKNILNKSELTYKRKQIEETLKEKWDFSEKDIASLKCRIADFNPAFLDAIGHVMGNFKDKKEEKKEMLVLGELLYNKDYDGFSKRMNDLEIKENTKK